MCSFLEWSPDIWAAIASIITAIFTTGLYFVARAGFKQLLNGEATKEQLDIVTKLITKLVEARLTLQLMNRESTHLWPALTQVNVFQVANYEKLLSPDENFELYSDLAIMITRLEDAFEFLSNPLLPSEIANNLNKIRYIAGKKRIFQKDIDEPFLIFVTQHSINSQLLLNEMQVYVTGGIRAWINACKNLKESIVKWLLEKGITDLNQVALLHKEE
jgi:hypothetical protein